VTDVRKYAEINEVAETQYNRRIRIKGVSHKNYLTKEGERHTFIPGARAHLKRIQKKSPFSTDLEKAELTPLYNTVAILILASSPLFYQVHR